MHIKTIASATILAAMLGLGGAAYAQTMIGNQSVSEADMERVKVYCEDLKTADGQAVGTTADDGAEENSGADAPAEGTSAETDTAAVGSIDLTAITLESCIEAGVIEK